MYTRLCDGISSNTIKIVAFSSVFTVTLTLSSVCFNDNNQQL